MTTLIQNEKYQKCIDLCNQCSEVCEYCITSCCLSGENLKKKDTIKIMGSVHSFGVNSGCLSLGSRHTATNIQ